MNVEEQCYQAQCSPSSLLDIRVYICYVLDHGDDDDKNAKMIGNKTKKKERKEVQEDECSGTT